MLDFSDLTRVALNVTLSTKFKIPKIVMQMVSLFFQVCVTAVSKIALPDEAYRQDLSSAMSLQDIFRQASSVMCNHFNHLSNTAFSSIFCLNLCRPQN